MWNLLQDLAEDESGVTSVEYALLAAAAATIIGLAGTAYYGKLQTAFESISLSGTTTTSTGSGSSSN